MPKTSSTPARPPLRARARARAPATGTGAQVGSLTPHLFVPTPDRPVRAKQRPLAADTVVVPHRHDWPQLTFSATGVIRVSTEGGTIIVPPSRAAWVPAGMEHSITVVEDAELRTVYLLPQPAPSADPAWQRCVVLEMGPLLHALAFALDSTPDGTAGPAGGAAHLAECRRRERMIAPLLRDELARAPRLRMGVPMPHAEHGDKRLRALCEAVLRAPARPATLAEWAASAGASERTAARLFRSELGISWQQWRQQALLAHALPLLARGMPVAHVAAASGYASDSAFTAMFRAAMGRSPRHFQNRNGL
ncbi:helix-turn-helix domain-containing protein [Xylophilus sp. Leaf220]|uniref:AraC family transcriptional regulator n=1 Tax=Xylophilus sp. Leaf220 TaxID=1735686 RepID=UPI0009E7AB7F|nr:helix-turn-helix transcriptional regulator [Xylophilus sp. Leaf220]